MRRTPRADICNINDSASFCAVAERAIQMGLRSLICCTSQRAVAEDISLLRARYEEDLNIFLAYRGDTSISEIDDQFDLLIGEPQSVDLFDEIVPFPKTIDEVHATLWHTATDVYYFLRKCYHAHVLLKEKTGCEAVHPFDPVSAWNQDGKLFDANCLDYRSMEWSAFDKLLCQNVIIVLDVNPCKKGVLPIQFPSMDCLRLIGQKCGRVALASNACDPTELCRSFPEAMAQLKACGIGSIYIYQKEGWKRNPL